MSRPSQRRDILLVLLVPAAYALVTLFPFNWTAPTRLPNAAAWRPGGGIAFPQRGIARLDSAPAWIAYARERNRLELDLRVMPFLQDQGGPARIFTISEDTWHRNLTVGQDGSDLVIRLRTPWADTNGMPNVRIPVVFQANAWVDLGIRVEPGILQVDIGGNPQLRRVLPPAPLQGWDPTYRLALGNELTYDRPWLGEIQHAIVRTGDLEVDYAAPGSPLVAPAGFLAYNKTPILVPFQELETLDAILNLVFYVPLGLLFGALTRRHVSGRWWLALLATLAVTVTLETLQLFVPDRQPSIDDVLFNTAGGLMGILLAQRPGMHRLGLGKRTDRRVD